MWIYYETADYEGCYNITGGFSSLEAAIKSYEKEYGINLLKTRKTKLDNTVTYHTSKYNQLIFEKLELIS